MVREVLLAAGEDEFASIDIHLRVKGGGHTRVRCTLRDSGPLLSKLSLLTTPNTSMHQVPWNWRSWLRFSSLIRGGRSARSPITMVLVLAHRGGR